MMEFSIDQGVLILNRRKAIEVELLYIKSQGNLDLAKGDKERRQNKKPSIS